MRMRQLQNLARYSAAENWAYEKLRATGVKFSRQTIWGCRLFDFWNAKLGIAVEIDGPEHDAAYDSVRDRYNYLRSGILVLRIRNFSEADLLSAIKAIQSSGSLVERKDKIRTEYGLPPGTPMRQVVKAAGLDLAHCKWDPPALA